MLLNEIKIEREPLFRALAEILSIKENKPFIFHKKTENLYWKKPIEHDDLMWGVKGYTTYYIMLDEKTLISHSALSSQTLMQDTFAINRQEHLDTYTSLSELENNIEPLLIQYPYLKNLFISKLEQFCSNNKVKISKNEIKNLVSDFVNDYNDKQINSDKQYTKQLKHL